jgi:tetratricopeptide (TPR) repeat protein
MAPAANTDAQLIRLLRQAQAQRQAGDVPGALQLLQQAARLAPGQPDIQHDIGAMLLQSRQAAQALRHFDTAIALDPHHGLAHFRRGVALEMLGRPGFEAAYEQAIAAAPGLAEAYACLASARDQAGQRKQALQLYQQAAARSQAGGVQALMYTARAALLQDRLPQAEAALRQLVAQAPKLSQARGLLANTLIARGDFTAAAAELEAALRDNPRDVSLYYNLLQTRRVTVADAPLIGRMRAALAFDVPAPARIRLHLALARALDQIGDYPAAQQALQSVGVLRQAQAGMDPAALSRHTDSSIALFTPAYLARPDHQSDASAVPILVLGLPRSGTTLTDQILSSHPDVASAGEVSFWEQAAPAALASLQVGQGARLADTARAYVTRLQDIAPGAAHVIDKNPFNYHWSLLAHLALPNARIIHCRRNLADTALSIIMTALRPSPLFSSSHGDLLVCMRQYLRLMAHVRRVLPPSRFHEVDYEAMVHDPASQTRALLKFLGLPWDDACLAPERNVGIVRTASVWQARQPVYTSSAGRWRNYAEMLGDFVALKQNESTSF